MSEDRVTVGRVVKAHGIRGEVAVDVLSDVPGRLDTGVEVFLDGRPTLIATSRPHQGRLLVRFEGIADRNAAELLRGRVIEAAPVDLDDAETYFVTELIDLPVLLEDDRRLGVVASAIELPDAAGYDLLEVRRDDGSTWLLPAVDEYVEIHDDGEPTMRLVVTDPPEGLIDDVPTSGDATSADAAPGDAGDGS